MATFTELPWELPVVAMPRTKILVVYNSDVAWTQGTCEYYCDQRGISRDQIIGVPAGTANIWISNAPDYNLTAAQFDNFLLPIAEALERGNHNVVILGPRFPTSVVVRNFSPDGTLGTGSFGSSYVSTSIVELVSQAKVIAASRRIGWAVGGNGNALVQLDPTLSGYALSDRVYAVVPAADTAYMWAYGGGLPSGGVAVRDPPLYAGRAGMVMPMPTADQQRELWAVKRPYVGVTRLGWSPGFHDNANVTPLPAETDETVRAFIDRATAVMAATNAAANRAKPHLIGITEGGTLLTSDMQSYYKQLVSWGIPTDYDYYFTAALTSPKVDDPPFSGARGNLTTLGAGTAPRPYQYFAILGGAPNGSPEYFSNDNLNFDGNQEALPGGNGLFSGASYPYVLNSYSISRGLAIAGFVDTVHQGGGLAVIAASIHMLLLRGMSYAEAICWVPFVGSNGYFLPIGDPLYAPYGRRAPFGMLGGVTDADAIEPGPNPSDFTFGSLTGAPRLGLSVSGGVTLVGMLTPLPIRVSWGAEWSVTSASEGFKTTAGTVYPGQTLWLRHVNGYAGITTTSRVHVGTATATFSSTAEPLYVDTPNPVVWPDRLAVELNEPTVSIGKEIRGFEVPIEVSVSAGSEFRFLLDYPEVWYSTPQMAVPRKGADADGYFWYTYVVLRHTSASTPETATTTTFIANGVESTFTSTTRAAADTQPDAFSFGTNPTGLALSAGTQTSAVATITGITAASAFTFTGSDGSCEWRKNGGSWVTTGSGSCVDGDTLQLRHTAGTGYSQTVSGTITFTSGPVAATFSSTTVALDTSPDAFPFTPVTGVALSTLTTSAPVTITGINSAATVTVSGGEWEKNSTNSWGSASGTVVNNDTVRVRHTSSGSNSTEVNTTLTVGGVSDTFTSTTVASGSFSAVLNTSTGVMTITDPSNGLGTKAAVTPLFARSMLTDSVGTLWNNLGGAGQGYSAKENDYLLTEQLAEVVAGEGIGGAPAFMSQHIAGSVNNKAKFTKFFASQQQSVFTSYWIKFVAVSPVTGENPGWVQLKWRRTGQSMPTLATHGTDANAQYSPRPGMFIAMWIDENTGEWPADVDDSKPWYDAIRSSNGGGGDAIPTTYIANGLALPSSEFSYGKQAYFETWDKMNDIGSSNGESRWRVNGTTMYTHNGFQLRYSGDENFGHIMPFTGPDMASGHLNAYQSRIYVDNTKQRVCIGDSATFTSCSGLINLPPTAWAAGAITVTDGLFIPAGYSYVFVLDANENVVSNGGAGFAYSTV